MTEVFNSTTLLKRIEDVLHDHLLNPPKASSWERETARGISACSFGRYELVITVQGTEYKIVIFEECTSISSRVWDSAVLTAKWLERKIGFGCLADSLDLRIDPKANRPVQVLELGAGTGLLSVCLAKMGAAVISTEYGPAVKQLKHNCDLNQVTQENRGSAGSVICRELDWFKAEDTLETLFNKGDDAIFDLIIASDCCLTKSEARKVADMIHKYGTPGHTVAIVSVCKHREGADCFLDTAREEFEETSIVPASDHHPDFTSRRHIIVRIQV